VLERPKRIPKTKIMPPPPPVSKNNEEIYILLKIYFAPSKSRRMSDSFRLDNIMAFSI